MRGDSLRDLYAKTIAVCGLGLLAGAGALVDYWPTAAALPFVRSAFPEPLLVNALPVPDELPALPALTAGAPRPARSHAGITAVPLPTLFVTPATDSMFGDSLALALPPMPHLGATSAQVTNGAEVALTEPAEPLMTMAMYAAPVSGADHGNGFIAGAAGAFKTAGSSIASAGSKTGAFIVGAGRTVTGVMRRVNPFN
jgi:hypothetical protein